MALTNILREPRREITETVVGVAVLLPLITLDWWLSSQVSVWGGCDGHDTTFPCAASGTFYLWFFLITPFALLVGTIIGGLILFFIHEMGESICNLLEAHGIQLRPRQRVR